MTRQNISDLSKFGRLLPQVPVQRGPCRGRGDIGEAPYEAVDVGESHESVTPFHVICP